MLYWYGVGLGVTSILRGRFSHESVKNILVPVNYWRTLEYRLTFRALDPRPDDRILDVGSPKLLSLYIAERIGSEVISTDIEPYFVEDYEFLRKARRIPEHRFRPMTADGRALPFPDGHFTKTYSISVVEHIPDQGDSDCLKELGRTLARGGRCVLTVPFSREGRNEYKEAGEFYWSGKSGPGDHPGAAFFQRRYSETDIRERLIRPSGLEEVEVLYFGDRFAFPGKREISEYLPKAVGLVQPLVSRLFQDRPSPSWRDLKHPRGALVVLRKP